MTTSANDDARVAYVTCPDETVAQRVASALVDARAAACVNIVPGLQSVYRWQGAIETDAELLLIIKTRAGCLDAIEAVLGRLHPDDVPELIALPITDGSQAYLEWLAEQTDAS